MALTPARFNAVGRITERMQHISQHNVISTTCLQMFHTVYEAYMHYHMRVACAACSADTEWVLFTNGDNLYHKDAFAEVVAAGQADAVAMDFYSRYTRPTGVPCERFQVRPPCGMSNCIHTNVSCKKYLL